MSAADAALERQFWPSPTRAKVRRPKGLSELVGILSKVGAIARVGRELDARVVSRAELGAHLRRAPQVLVKITGASRGMTGVATHLNYIGDHGRRPVEDQDGTLSRSAAGLKDLVREWRDAGARLPRAGERKEAHHILFQMPAGTDAAKLQDAVRAFSRAELEGHHYAMALHTHQSTPHVHLIVRTERTDGVRLNPRKGDLHRWRLRFAHELRERGVDAAASRQRTRGHAERHEALWEKKLAARREQFEERAGRLRAIGEPSAAEKLQRKAQGLRTSPATRRRPADVVTRQQLDQAERGWLDLVSALGSSTRSEDRVMAGALLRQIEQDRVRAPVRDWHERKRPSIEDR